MRAVSGTARYDAGAGQQEAAERVNELLGEHPPPNRSVDRFPSATASTLAPSDVSPSARGYGTHGLMTQAGHSSVVVDEELPLSVSGRLHGKPRIPSFCVPCARWGPRGGTTVAATVWRSIGGVKHRFGVNPLHTCTVTSRPVPSWHLTSSEEKKAGRRGRDHLAIASPTGSFINHF
ncbi:hypothetical protein GE21DRAFT_1289592 [Neurospora crassa]|nr:hypothetical protein GE21DRAFT_1289592 [Neurospora crassa]